MQLGMLGLGRMGSSMVRRLIKAGHECVVYDVHPEPGKALEKDGAVAAASLEDFVTRLIAPRAVWLMLPAGVVDDELAALVPLLDAGDTVIDGGNSQYHGDIRRAKELKPKNIHYVDVGTSGGVWGLEQGYLHCGSNGAGHFVKMVRSWLLDLTASSLVQSPDLAGYAGRVSDSGEGRWTIAAALDEAIPTPVLSMALYARFSSRGEADFADKLLSAMRHGFGGHLELGTPKNKGQSG
jgi:6-phosphogluconate dehydrogenase